MSTDLRSQNDNSKEYRAKREKQRDKLLERALENILTSDRDFRFSNICKVMNILAIDEDRALNANIKQSAISKNKTLKNKIKAFQTRNKVVPKTLNKNKLTEGDLAFELHKCKTFLAEKTDEVNLLKRIIEAENLSEGQDKLIQKTPEYDYKFLTKKLCELMLKDGMMYIHNGSAYLELESNVEFLNETIVKNLGLNNE